MRPLTLFDRSVVAKSSRNAIEKGRKREKRERERERERKVKFSLQKRR